MLIHRKTGTSLIYTDNIAVINIQQIIKTNIHHIYATHLESLCCSLGTKHKSLRFFCTTSIHHETFHGITSEQQQLTISCSSTDSCRMFPLCPCQSTVGKSPCRSHSPDEQFNHSNTLKQLLTNVMNTWCNDRCNSCCN